MSEINTKCKNCGKRRGDHLRSNHSCPLGKKSILGYFMYDYTHKFDPCEKKETKVKSIAQKKVKK